MKSASRSLSASFAVLFGAALSVTTAACSLESDVGSREATPRPSAAADGDEPIDILFVVDNSGSMAEEQRRLAEALWGDDCPITDLRAVPLALQDPDEETQQALSERCGLAQLLAAFDRDFHIGVITTDVNACDNTMPDAMGGWDRGFRPQRGCLQPEPRTGAKVLTRDDPDLPRSFLRVLTDIGTYGSPWERGLDAAHVFLTHDSWTAPGCEGDRALFLRDDAELLVVFVTDEDDCSHLGAAEFPDVASAQCGEDTAFIVAGDPASCASNAAALNPVSSYVDALRALKGDGRVRAALIGGVVESGDDVIGAGCLADGSGVAQACFESGGMSNHTVPGAPCSEERSDERGGLPCCTADAAHRYLELEAALGGARFSASSICADDYRVQLLEAGLAQQEPVDG